nr:lipopolysaccharide-induced tumor necrosis factor-alpha factor homolog [Helicoverpa armigera]
MSDCSSDYEDHDDPKGQGQPPPYSESTTDVPPTERAATTTTMHSSTSTAIGVGAAVTVVTAQPTYPAYPTAVVYQGNMNYVPAGVNVGQGPFIGPKESPMTCPSCQQSITTKVEYKSTMGTHICALMFCMVGFIPCMIIPYCVKSCRNADHYCPECNAFLGTYIRA